MAVPRYAIYAVPEGVFYARGAAWLGWDSAAGRDIAQPALAGLSPEVTARPARYGFHATLRAPFVLQDGVSYEDLVTLCENLGRSLPALSIGPLQLVRLGRFLALIPEPQPEITAFASEIVRRTNDIRKPLSEEEIERRSSDRFGSSDRDYLRRWGYAHVMDRFKLHFTLTEKLGKTQLDTLESAATDWFQSALNDHLAINSLCIMGEEPHSKRFRLLHRISLKG
ncbi:DUF1045 domain-containing protein [Thioclava kandeliae]|uniref:DUF1045 domain-containing protein n=1 Tax=Thioclava kandeliae TaxID=3070818 RepID=A0ABV1SES6_9RHOB